MLTIGVLAPGGIRADVTEQLASLGNLEWLDGTDALVERAGGGALDAVVTELTDNRGRSISATLVDLVAARPSLPILLHTRIDRSAIDHLMAVFTLGTRMECAVRPFARQAPMLREMLSPMYRPGVAPLLLHHFMPLVPASLHSFVAVAILVAPQPRGVEEVARWSGVSPRTIERRLRRAGWPAARVVLQSFTALDAVWLMTEYGWSARRVQQVRRFSHPSGVTRLLGAYVGSRPSTLAEDGGLSAALEHVAEVLAGR